MTESFTERYERLYKQAGISQKELCRKTGIVYQTIADKKHRQTVFSAEECIKIADILGVSVEYFVTGKTKEVDSDIEEAKSILSQIPKQNRQEVITALKAFALYFNNPK